MTSPRPYPEPALLTPAEMAAADRLTMDGGTPGIDLMERAGQAVAREAAALAEGQPSARIVVLCGPGNNGGDGFIAARCLVAAGHRPDVWLLKEPADLKGDALEAFRRMKLPIREINAGDSIAYDLPDEIARADVVIDALFGAGLDRPLDGLVLKLVGAVNSSGVPVLAVDLPSGLSGADGSVQGDAIRAAASVTFFRAKPGHLLMPGKALCGDLTVADIGIRSDVLTVIRPATFENASGLWRHAWPEPDPLGHKYSRGHAVVFGGPMSATGAARLSAGAALRAGSGLVTLASPPDAMMVNACHLTAVMLKKVADAEAIETFLEDVRLNALLIGPGYGLGEDTRTAVLTLLRADRATVLDADALTAFEGAAEDLFRAIAGRSAPVVLTPHEGEFARLFPNLRRSKLARARAAARASGAVVVLKGPDTVIAQPGGRAAINRNAPPWLATAGSGDVLAGIVTGLLAQGVPAFEAACQAVWLHGEAARAAGPGLTAEDLAPALKSAIGALVDKAGGRKKP